MQKNPGKDQRNKKAAAPGGAVSAKNNKPTREENPNESLGRTEFAFQLVWQRHSFFLRAGSWRQLFTEVEFKTLLAEALNECVCYRCEDDRHGHDMRILCDYLERLHIAGYFMVEEGVYLVWDIAELKFPFGDKESIDDIKKDGQFLFMLNRFYDTVKMMLEKHRDRLREYSRKAGEEIGLSGGDLFTRRKITDEYLVKLITGHAVNLEYDDPRLTRWMKRLHNAEFCSVIDYEGGVGPVIMRGEEWS